MTIFARRNTVPEQYIQQPVSDRTSAFLMEKSYGAKDVAIGKKIHIPSSRKSQGGSPMVKPEAVKRNSSLALTRMIDTLASSRIDTGLSDERKPSLSVNSLGISIPDLMGSNASKSERTAGTGKMFPTQNDPSQEGWLQHMCDIWCCYTVVLGNEDAKENFVFPARPFGRFCDFVRSYYAMTTGEISNTPICERSRYTLDMLWKGEVWKASGSKVETHLLINEHSIDPDLRHAKSFHSSFYSDHRQKDDGVEKKTNQMSRLMIGNASVIFAAVVGFLLVFSVCLLGDFTWHKKVILDFLDPSLDIRDGRMPAAWFKYYQSQAANIFLWRSVDPETISGIITENILWCRLIASIWALWTTYQVPSRLKGTFSAVSLMITAVWFVVGALITVIEVTVFQLKPGSYVSELTPQGILSVTKKIMATIGTQKPRGYFSYVFEYDQGQTTTDTFLPLLIWLSLLLCATFFVWHRQMVMSGGLLGNAWDADESEADARRHTSRPSTAASISNLSRERSASVNRNDMRAVRKTSSIENYADKSDPRVSDYVQKRKKRNQQFRYYLGLVIWFHVFLVLIVQILKTSFNVSNVALVGDLIREHRLIENCGLPFIHELMHESLRFFCVFSSVVDIFGFLTASSGWIIAFIFGLVTLHGPRCDVPPNAKTKAVCDKYGMAKGMCLSWNIHVLKFLLVFVDHFNINQRRFLFGDILVASVLVLSYLLFYVVVYDRIGAGFYPGFNFASRQGWFEFCKVIFCYCLFGMSMVSIWVFA